MSEERFNDSKVIAELLLILINKTETIMTQLDDLTSALAQLKTDQSTAIADIGAKFTALEAQITALQAASPAVDLTAALAAVADLDASIKAADPGVQTAAPAAPTT